MLYLYPNISGELQSTPSITSKLSNLIVALAIISSHHSQSFSVAHSHKGRIYLCPCVINS